MTNQQTQTKTKGTRGGYRENSGRPSIGSKSFNVYLSLETLKTLDEINPKRSVAIRMAAKSYNGKQEPEIQDETGKKKRVNVGLDDETLEILDYISQNRSHAIRVAALAFSNQ